MPRIAGVDIPANKSLEVGLTYIYGVGRKMSKRIIDEADLDPETKSQDLTDQQIAKIREIIEKQYMVEGDLRREVQNNIKRLTEIGCYKGMRHRLGLPVRGQKTKSNARTRKGPRGTAIAKKKKTTK
jgi:small subunit ribosomal protein S13